MRMAGIVGAIPSAERNSAAMTSIDIEPSESTPLFGRNHLHSIRAEDQFKDKFMDVKICFMLFFFLSGVTVGAYLLYHDAPS